MLRSLKWCCNVSGAMNSLHIHVPGPQEVHRDLPVVFMHARGGGGGCLLTLTHALALPAGNSIASCLSIVHSTETALGVIFCLCPVVLSLGSA